MSTRPAPTRLARREITAIRDERGVVIDCLSGALWITADGVAGDHVLGPGERLRLCSAGRVFISALEPATFTATPSRGAAPVRTLAARCAAAVLDSIRRWQHLPLAAYPVTRLR